MSIGSFVVSLRVFLIDNVFSVCFTCILRWFFSSNKKNTLKFSKLLGDSLMSSSFPLASIAHSSQIDVCKHVNLL